MYKCLQAFSYKTQGFILLFVSATWPQGVRRLAQSYMKNPIQVFVGSLDLAAVHTVTQRVYLIDESEKRDMVSGALNLFII